MAIDKIRSNIPVGSDDIETSKPDLVQKAVGKFAGKKVSNRASDHAGEVAESIINKTQHQPHDKQAHLNRVTK